VRHIVEGSVRVSGGHRPVTAQLIDAASGFHLWSETFDRELADIFVVQDEVSRAIAANLLATVNRAGEPSSYSRSGHLDAYRLYLQGRFAHHQFRPDTVEKSLSWSSQSIEMEPSARAYAGLTDAQVLLAFMDAESARERLRNAWLAATNGVRLDDTYAPAHTALAEREAC
jgi:adenylate cyclase